MKVNIEPLVNKLSSQIAHRVTSHSSSDIIQCKILNTLVRNARDEMLAAVESTEKKSIENYLEKTRGQEIKFTITMSQLEEAVDLEIKSRKLIEELLFNLGTTAVQFDIINSQGAEEWVVMPLLTKFNLEDNKITYRFCSELREEILISRAEPVTDSV
ncbi:MAG: hypothetical protein CMK63_06150 [Pseudoalteromonadaceae bacterium]|nr:hypothetical protein [Pseudoalteromonadaceae bacterium]